MAPPSRRREEARMTVTNSTIETTRTVIIPSCANHGGYQGNTMDVTLRWTCPTCGGPRGEPMPARSYDGSRWLSCARWENPCGHIDHYPDVRDEVCGDREAACAAALGSAWPRREDGSPK